MAVYPKDHIIVLTTVNN